MGVKSVCGVRSDEIINDHYGGENEKIVIMEDERPIARALELKLSHEGFDVKCAYDGEDGVALVEREQPDLILTDLVMPKRDGFFVLETLKAKGSAIPVIVLSNLSQQEDEQRVKALGAKDFFVKSNTPLADVVVYVRRILG